MADLDPEEIQRHQMGVTNLRPRANIAIRTTHSIQGTQGVPSWHCWPDGEITDEEIPNSLPNDGSTTMTSPKEPILCRNRKYFMRNTLRWHHNWKRAPSINGLCSLDFIDCSKSVNVSKIDIEELQSKYKIAGLCCIDPDIEFDSKIFCFTGKSTKAYPQRRDLRDCRNHNGIFNNNVSKDTPPDYRNEGSPAGPSVATVEKWRRPLTPEKRCCHSDYKWVGLLGRVLARELPPPVIAILVS